MLIFYTFIVSVFKIIQTQTSQVGGAQESSRLDDGQGHSNFEDCCILVIPEI